MPQPPALSVSINLKIVVLQSNKTKFDFQDLVQPFELAVAFLALAKLLHVASFCRIFFFSFFFSILRFWRHM